ncbi:hypothetical protein [Catenulispora pinisilvae]|uniref:hypothetical protein n=1 Tax=Catenulispora pinisilvae TaxID=2705253 RepID=UPI0018925A2A|nr:hypothetical protein [Catenulispora pinisilvae]
MTFAPSRSPSFNTRWFPLVSDVFADRAEVSASNLNPYHDWYSVSVVLYVWTSPRFGKPGRWAGVDPQSSAIGLRVPGLTDPEHRGRDHVELLCPARLPVWECRWCHVVHDELTVAARCAGDCWAARCRANEEAMRRWYAANPPRW